jgi:hypothetical protein
MIASVALNDLLELAWVALAATVILSVAASVCVLGVTRASELRRAGHGGQATGYAALGVAGAVGVVAGAAGALAIIIGG